ncbi:MAG: hypothetical protein IPK65_05260 [Gammaproteobacteria bacterium]|nr:hypothetical protein [Gammaproteobacteria bacterium]
MRRAERLLGMCLLLAAALSACTAMPPRDDARPAASIHPPPAPAESPAAPATAGVQAVQESPERPAIAPEAPAPAQAGTLELLRDAAQYSGLPPDIQHDVFEGAETRLNIEQTPLALVRFALLLSLSEPNRQSDADTSARLRELLAQPPADTDSAGLAPLAQVLARLLDDRGRMAAQNAELKHKLNQLKAIEQQLGDRDGADMPTPAP